MGVEQVFSVQFSPVNSNTILVLLERSRDFRNDAATAAGGAIVTFWPAKSRYEIDTLDSS